MQRKSINLELKDIDRTKRTSVIAHSVYDSIDRTKDISRKGMFKKSWNESKEDISFYFNHDDTQSPGSVVNVFEDEHKAYTEVKLGTHTLGNDTLIMMDEGVIKKASFGYIVEKKNYIDIKGQRVRELKEVQHIETSVLTKMPAHPNAGVVSVVKSVQFKKLSDSEQGMLKLLASNTQATLQQLVELSGTLDVDSDLYMWIGWVIERHASLIGEYRSQLRYNTKELKELKQHSSTLEKFIRNTNASDDCVKSISEQAEEIKSFLAEYDTDTTPLIMEPVSSKNAEAIKVQLKNINNLFKQTK